MYRYNLEKSRESAIQQPIRLAKVLPSLGIFSSQRRSPSRHLLPAVALPLLRLAALPPSPGSSAMDPTGGGSRDGWLAIDVTWRSCAAGRFVRVGALPFGSPRPAEHCHNLVDLPRPPPRLRPPHSAPPASSMPLAMASPAYRRGAAPLQRPPS